MTKTTKVLKSNLGYFRSGGVISIPYDLDPSSVKAFTQGFTVDDQVDLLCVTEYHLLLRESHEFKGRDYAVIRLVFEDLLNHSIFDPFQSELTSMGLVTSLNRIRHGMNLIF